MRWKTGDRIYDSALKDRLHTRRHYGLPGGNDSGTLDTPGWFAEALRLKLAYEEEEDYEMRNYIAYSTPGLSLSLD